MFLTGRRLKIEEKNVLREKLAWSRKKKVFSEPFSTDIPVQMYYGNLVLGKRLSAPANRPGGGKPAPFNEQTKVTDSALRYPVSP